MAGFFGVLWLAAPLARATNPAMALVTHPVHLGAHANPHEIPLSAVAVWHNYGYGIHGVISKFRAFPDGPLAGREVDMNLASVYDIHVLPEDSTLVPLLPVTLKVGDRALPPGARHTRGQALEATLWSLLLLTPGSEKYPLVVKIDSPDPEHLKLAGSYVLEPGRLELVAGEIPGSRLVRDNRGVLSVVFKNEDLESEAAPAAVDAPRLAFVPLLSGGGAEGNELIALIPHWTGRRNKTAALELLWTAMPRAMNVLSSKNGENANPLHAAGLDAQGPGRQPGKLGFYGSSGGESVDENLRRVFAAACHGAISTLAVTEAGPLEISFQGHPAEAWTILGDEGWELHEGTHGSATWRRSFSDPGRTILGYRLIPRYAGGWWLDSGKADVVEEPETPDLVPEL